MRLITPDIPEQSAEWPRWLERQLVGLRLAEFVVELETLLPPETGKTPSLQSVCRAELPEVHRRGLSALSAEQIRLLLAHPALLLPLQEEVLVNGGEYWGMVERTTDHVDVIPSSWEQLYATCLGETAVVEDDSVRTVASSPVRPRRRQLWLALSTLASLLIIGAGLWLNRPQTPTWGFDRGGVLTADVASDEYLNSLADAAQDWFNKRPEQAADVIQRLRDFEHGCDTLIRAPHPQLAAADRAWLIERCEAWKSKFVTQRTELEAGTLTPLEARDAADETVRALQKALRTRTTLAVG